MRTKIWYTNADQMTQAQTLAYFEQTPVFESEPRGEGTRYYLRVGDLCGFTWDVSGHTVGATSADIDQQLRNIEHNCRHNFKQAGLEYRREILRAKLRFENLEYHKYQEHVAYHMRKVDEYEQAMLGIETSIDEEVEATIPE